jgi:hypothetical protein
MAAASKEREDSWLNILEDPREDIRTGDREANCRISCRITKHQTLDLVEGSTPSKTEKGAGNGVRGGKMGAPATRILSPHKWNMVVHRARCQEWPCWLVAGSKLLLCSALLCLQFRSDVRRDENTREFQKTRGARCRQQWGNRYPEGVECVTWYNRV